ncbi:PSD1 and planctomycete cytochrome C domain-containing protein [Stieleria sp. TO1_6]|uniref:PSD1 and planctomycete cytochrome C domain-containing protein n=1 Tax=Stieleria tagensis TaxID=2956795 RepID=UPI00209B17FC|nr:PSD1 and planctomycete cytochrome C domain-containing protein [Stieleria tagensis]MCO8124120.1 PSD1 and planctomycete cytochrome C domain-containing protein [Stieleria tagensis]
MILLQTRRVARTLMILCCLWGTGSSSWAADPAARALTGEQTKFFESNIRPVLVRECYGCHSKQSGQSKGGLRLDTQAATLQGGDSGAAIVPGDLDASLLYGAITHTDFVMPPKRKLSDAEIADFRTWILSGAADPRIVHPVDSPATAIDDQTIEQAKRSFWAYQPPQRSELAEVGDASDDWSKTTIDRFLKAKLDQSGLAPADDADAPTVLRRLCFDLIGLPPTPEQHRHFALAFERDPGEAIAVIVDQLLKQPEYGQHWGRHWLDVVRFAESTGREVNMTYPHAWRYRDYVIDSFNADKPFDEFVREQIAGDLLPAADDREWSEHLIATTFLAMGTKNVNEQSRAQFAADLADEQIDTSTRVFLGTSVACARCHDHKFDPIRQSDYYAMAGIFRSTKTFFGNPPSQYGSFSGPQTRQTSSLILLPVADENPIGRSYTQDELQQLHEQIQQKRLELSQLRRGNNSTGAGPMSQQMRIRLSNELASLSAKLSVVDERGDPRSYCMGVQDGSVSGDAPLLVRGEIDQPADRVPRGIPVVLGQIDPPSPRSSGRLELARWIGSEHNTLAARVMVNRIWHHVFGQGIVPTTEDFGMTGIAPSHPALLDHLSIEFVDSGWSVKEIVRQLVCSRAYRMQSRMDRTSHESDPDNRLLWRANVKRLPAESLRDAMLSVAGKLQTESPRASKVAQAGYMRVRSDQLEDPRDRFARAFGTMLTSRGRSGRFRADRLRESNDMSIDSVSANYRSVYLPVVRDFLPRSLEVFDFADPSLVTGARETSNTPNQALYLMNNPLTVRLSESFAKRLIRESRTQQDRIESAFQLVYGRSPSVAEQMASQEYLEQSGLSPLSALSTFCQSLFASAEFRYLN